MRKIHSKIKVLEWSQKISHCKSMQFFYDAQGQLTPVWGWFYMKFKLIQTFMAVLVTWKNEEDQKKHENEGTRVVTTLPINFKKLNGS